MKAATPQQRAEAARMYSVSERLSRRNRTETYPVTLPDDLGKIEIYVKAPSLRVLSELQDIQEKFAKGFKGDTAEALIKIEDRIGHLLGEDVCAPGQGLDYDFWKYGDYDPSLPFELMGAVMKADYEAGASFRKNGGRKTPGRAVHKNGKTTR